MRVVLAEEVALALVTESLGELARYRCPDQDGWHVWNPGAERDSAYRPRLD
jgi:hypothetical protein